MQQDHSCHQSLPTGCHSLAQLCLQLSCSAANPRAGDRGGLKPRRAETGLQTTQGLPLGLGSAGVGWQRARGAPDT